MGRFSTRFKVNVSNVCRALKGLHSFVEKTDVNPYELRRKSGEQRSLVHLFFVRVFFVIVSCSWLTGVLAQDCLPTSEAPPAVNLEPVAEGFTLPLYVTSPAGDARLFVLERTGQIKIVDGQGSSKVFADLSLVLGLTGEMGLLNLAFHPDYAANGRLFVLLTRETPFDTVVMELQRDPENAERTLPARRVVLSVPQDPKSVQHRGGQLEFYGSDLYVSLGDGALSSPAQDDTNLDGKVLRLDVDAVADVPLSEDQELAVPVEIFAKGFRNPWRFSFDTCNGDLYVADLGSTRFEELNKVVAGGNYGWPYFESYECSELGQETDCDIAGMTFPFYAYPNIAHDPQGGNGVIGGYVYRGEQLPQLKGFYIFADLKGTLWALREIDGAWYRWDLAEPGGGTVSLGQDADGELYVINMTAGVIYKLAPSTAAASKP
jgi:glucose/arabinose dehydrogenase